MHKCVIVRMCVHATLNVFTGFHLVFTTSFVLDQYLEKQKKSFVLIAWHNIP